MSNDNSNDNAAQGFSEQWLALREPADHAARSTTLGSKLAGWAKQHESLNIVELGAGTGSNLRYLMPQLGQNQHWVLIDNDADLLNRLPEILHPWAKKNAASITANKNELLIEHENYSATVTVRLLNLAEQLDKLPMHNVDLLTASALLDLTSASWLDQLANLVAEHQCSCLFVLNYDGNIHWQPKLDSDNTIKELLNLHQLKNKGFGHALGPEAGAYFAGVLEQLGRSIDTDDSNWSISEQSQALQQAIVDGWATAALEQNNAQSEIIDDWHGRRRKIIESAESSLIVGHVDVLSLLNRD